MNTDLSPLTLENARGTALKLSLNVLHKDPNLTIMTLPVEGIELVQEQLDGFLGKHTFRSWYDQRADGSWHPCAWWHHRDDADYPIDAAFHTDKLTLGLSGEQVLEFERQEPEEEDDDAVPAAKITAIRLKPTPGGVTLLSFHLQVRPGLGKDNLLLQEHQFRPVTITLGETKIAPKKGKQQSLALEPAKEPTAPIETELTNEQRAELAQARQGESTEQSEHPDPDATNGDPSVDLARFEEGARAEAERFKQRASGVIDGRSERVKHQDETKYPEAPKFPPNTDTDGEAA
jgi:hypothetical protein